MARQKDLDPARRAFLSGRLRPTPAAIADELHISSLLVQHRPAALADLERAVAAQPGLDIVLRGESRCVVVCETEDQRGVMDHIDTLGSVKGVLSVSLVYHHAEPRENMDESVDGPSETPT